MLYVWRIASLGMTVMKRNIVLNIPHASINGVFDPKYGGWPNNQYFVNPLVELNL
jgi:hypothetical protein